MCVRSAIITESRRESDPSLGSIAVRRLPVNLPDSVRDAVRVALSAVLALSFTLARL